MKSRVIQDFVTEFRKFIPITLTTILFITVMTIFGFIHHASNDIERQIYNTIYEFNDFDRTHICNTIGCEYVIVNKDKNETYYKSINRELTSSNEYTTYSATGKFTINNLTIYPLSGEMGIELVKYNTIFVVDFPQTMRLVVGIAFILIIIIVAMVILYYNYIIKTIRTNDLMSYSSEKTNLQSLITSVLTENLHHEMKTPLASMMSELRNIKKQTKRELVTCNKCPNFNYSESVDLSFDIIEENIKSIHNIIETIKTSKMMRYSNGNRSIYDIISSAKDITRVTAKVKFFDIEIDENFKSYSLDKFRNEDLLNIIINHLKNSVEANSTKIVFDCPNNISSTGYLLFYIIDNGNGISQKAKDHIYDLHFSTKGSTMNESMRGVGMYLSKQLLKAYGGIHGDEWLHDTSSDGTTFAIRVPAKIKHK